MFIRIFQTFNEELKSLRSFISKCSAEADRLKNNKRMTRRSRRNRDMIKKEITNEELSIYSITKCMEKKKAKLSRLARSRRRKLLNEKAKTWNRKFKEKYYIKSLSGLKSSPFLFGATLFKLALMVDILAARVSYFLYNLSPSLENFIFWPLKFFRESGSKFFIVNWFHYIDPNTKKDSGIDLNPYVERHVA